MNRMRTLLFVGCILLCLSGLSCEDPYPYEVSGRVRDAATGKPLEGVKLALVKAEGDFPDPTDSNGKFWGKYSLSADDFENARPGKLPGCLLKLSKEGYFEEEIDIHPMKVPKSNDEQVRIVVVAYLRRK